MQHHRVNNHHTVISPWFPVTASFTCMCRLCIRPRLLSTHHHCHCMQVAITQKNTKIAWLCIIHTWKNTKITQFSRFLGKFRTCTVQAAETRHSFCSSMNVGYEATYNQQCTSSLTTPHQSTPHVHM